MRMLRTDIKGPFPVSETDIQDRSRLFPYVDRSWFPGKFHLSFCFEVSCWFPIEDAVPHHVVQRLGPVSSRMEELFKGGVAPTTTS